MCKVHECLLQNPVLSCHDGSYRSCDNGCSDASKYKGRGVEVSRPVLLVAKRLVGRGRFSG
jgi:hypothetical protein